MAEIDGGALSFKSVMDNDQLNGAIEETLRRVQGFSDAVVGTGDAMDSTTQEMVECIEVQKRVIQDLETTVSDLNTRIDALEPGDAQNILIEQANAARQELEAERKGLADLESQLNTMQQANAGAAMSFEQVRATLGQIGAACQEHENALESLEAEYDRLGAEMDKAYMSGRDEEFNALKQQQAAIQGEIRIRKSLLNELRDQSNALEDVATKIETERANAEKAANAHTSLRTKIREVKEQMADLRANGIDENSAAYKNLVNELGRLQDIQGDIQAQGSIMANDQNQFAGLLSGLQGVVGGFTAAQGAVALFGAENEELQRIMLKVQSLMSITMGLQQVAQTLNKDSAFSLVTLNNAKEWWNNLLEVGRGKQIEETAAMEANTVAQATNTASKTAGATAEAAKATAQATGTAAAEANTAAQGVNTAATGAQTGAAIAGTTANIGLAGAFRMVGAAIKSIPVFGWILAGISALIGLVSHFVGKAREAKKAQEEWYKSVAENVYKPVAAIEELSVKWNKLGNDLEAKKKFVQANKKTFDELGASINDVADAENLLSNPAQVQKFINAQIKKAEAMIYIQRAQEKVKTLMEQEQKYNNMSDTKSTYVQTSSFGTGYYVESRNTEKDKLKAANDALRKEIEDGFRKAAEAETEGATILKDAGMEATQSYADGTLGAIQEAIRMKQEALNNLTNNDDYKKALKEIEDLQKQADKITGAKRTTGGSSTTQDPFLAKLNKYKSEYTRFMKWINSGDEVLVKAANQEFAGLLKEGATYIDYLKSQRDTILQIDIESRTAEQNKQLRQLNDSIAEETKNTVLEAFNNELSEQLTNAQSIIEMLNIIEQKRKQLSGDGTELDNAKQEALDNAEKDAQAQLKDETQALLDDYASYMEKRRRIDEQYNADVALLQQKRTQAQSDSERAEIDAAIKNRTSQYEKDTKGSGNADYDAMLADYGTFEQRKQQIIDEYEEKRKIAREMGDKDMVDALDNAQAKALSSLTSEELTNSDIWGQLFNNLDEMSASEIEKLVNEIEKNFENLSVSFNPADLAKIREQLESAKDELVKDNPFKQMGQALKAVFSDASKDSKDSADGIKKNWKKLGEATEKSFDFIANAINQCEPLKDMIGDVGTTAISSLQAVVMASIGVAEAIKTAERSSVILVIIQAALVAVQAIFSLFMLGDKAAEKRIKKHQAALKDLENAYKQLEWQIDKALGTDVYAGQLDAIRNMEAQQKHLQAMWREEEGKKKTDQDKVRDYKEQYADLTRQIEDMYEAISKDILQTDAKDFAGTLGDSLVEAFKKGEDASKAFEETVNEVLQNAIVNQLKKKFLEQQLQGALDQLELSMGYWNGDDFIFDGLTDEEIAAFKRKVESAANNFNQALGIYKDLFKDIVEDKDDSLTGAVRGVTEETASIVAGQMNAIRINQLEATQVMRQSLQQLNMIAANTQYNRYLVKIDRIISLLENSDSSLRSQGLS